MGRAGLGLGFMLILDRMGWVASLVGAVGSGQEKWTHVHFWANVT